jgi:hypothetical protein
MIPRCRFWIPACARAHRRPVFPGLEERWTVGAGRVLLAGCCFGGEILGRGVGSGGGEQGT